MATYTLVSSFNFDGLFLPIQLVVYLSPTNSRTALISLIVCFVEYGPVLSILSCYCFIATKVLTRKVSGFIGTTLLSIIATK